jgi:PPOX class probable F420-dependent enzyme
MPAQPPTAPARKPAVSPALSPALSPGIRAYLAEVRYAAVSTISPDGAPHQAFIWYLLVDDGLVINSRRERRWPSNLTRDPRISIAVQDWKNPEHWVGLKGTAELLHEGEDALADIAAMARRYDDDDGERFRGQDRVSFLVRVERSFEYGG